MIAAAESAFAQRYSSPVGLGRALASLGREQPVVFDELMNAPVVLRHRDVAAALRDTATFSTQFYGTGPMNGAMITLDGAPHHRLRRIHNRFFSASASAKYADAVAPIAQRTFGPVAAKAEVELIGECIARYPMEVFLTLLGIPDELGDQGLAWVRAIVTWLGSPMDQAAAEPGLQAYAQLSDYTSGLVQRERHTGGDNLLSEIINGFESEDAYTTEAVTASVVSLLLGGFETTIQMMSATLCSLLLNPDALARVRADHSLVEAAIDEAFRWANPSAGLYRLVTRDTGIAGTGLAAGSLVYLGIAGAHYDERAYPDPETFHLDRRGGAHLGFGLGPHYCVGAPLARIEVTAALTALLDACPGLRLDSDTPLSFYYGARDFVQHGTDALPVLT
ncbi:MAG: cytochrome P450 [Hamadaea sp.]|uniref:cytochrome P450 n=1 Tax=Hamadaea sp. TaxID=2024425 RepID=UPI001845B05D|nr:cytochrome P450 [Hamadaea sp.]NUR74610.1 cytochrome P450 [Hamadaea sp.]NUT17626.1 cytochrome P450 [Hamadaea sp.]